MMITVVKMMITVVNWAGPGLLGPSGAGGPGGSARLTFHLAEEVEKSCNVQL